MGISAAETNNATIRCSGRWNTSATWWKVLLSAPWNVIKANKVGTMGLRTPIC